MFEISKRGYQQGPSDGTLKEGLCQFCDDKFGHRIMEAVGFFDYKMRNFTQIAFNFQTGEARVLFHDFLIRLCISDISINYILSNKII